MFCVILQHLKMFLFSFFSTLGSVTDKPSSQGNSGRKGEWSPVPQQVVL